MAEGFGELQSSEESEEGKELFELLLYRFMFIRKQDFSHNILCSVRCKRGPSKIG